MSRARKKNQSKDERLIEEGKSALRRSYRESMISFAKEILQDAKEEGFEDYDEAHDWIDDQIQETTSSTSWVIYTANALDVLVASDNWTAIEDAGVAIPSDVTQAVTTIASYAVFADLQEYVDSYEDEYFTETENNPRRRRKKKKTKKKRSKKRGKKKSRRRNPLLSSLLR